MNRSDIQRGVDATVEPLNEITRAAVWQRIEDQLASPPPRPRWIPFATFAAGAALAATVAIVVGLRVATPPPAERIVVVVPVAGEYHRAFAGGELTVYGPGELELDPNANRPALRIQHGTVIVRRAPALPPLEVTTPESSRTVRDAVVALRVTALSTEIASGDESARALIERRVHALPPHADRAAPAPHDALASPSPAPHDGVPAPSPASHDGVPAPSPAPGDMAAAPTPSPHDAVAAPSPASRDRAAASTPAPGDRAAAPTPASRDRAAASTLSPHDGVAAPSPASAPAPHDGVAAPSPATSPASRDRAPASRDIAAASPPGSHDSAAAPSPTSRDRSAASTLSPHDRASASTLSPHDGVGASSPAPTPHDAVAARSPASRDMAAASPPGSHDGVAAPSPASRDTDAPAPVETLADRYARAERAIANGDRDTARALLEAIAHDDATGRLGAAASYDLALLAVRRGDPAAALRHLERVLGSTGEPSLRAPAQRLRCRIQRARGIACTPESAPRGPRP